MLRTIVLTAATAGVLSMACGEAPCPDNAAEYCRGVCEGVEFDSACSDYLAQCSCPDENE